MILEPAGYPAGTSRPAGAAAGSRGSVSPPPLVEPLTAGQIERAFPAYHVWVSDAGWWYATRIRPWARGQAATVHGPGPGELSGALAEEEAATLGRAMTGAW